MAASGSVASCSLFIEALKEFRSNRTHLVINNIPGAVKHYCLRHRRSATYIVPDEFILGIKCKIHIVPSLAFKISRYVILGH